MNVGSRSLDNATAANAVKASRSSTTRLQTQRVFTRVPVWIYGNAARSGPFQERTYTVQVHEKGCVVALQTPVEVGQALLLANMATGEEQYCSITALAPKGNGHTDVEIVFRDAAPRFWRVAFPAPGEKPLRR